MAELRRYLEHTLLKPDASQAEIRMLCEEARRARLFGVCVNSSQVPLASACLSGSGITLVSVVGFPLGAASTAAKAFEAAEAARAGAQEIDMVIHVGALIEGRADYVRRDIRAVVEAAGQFGARVKVILEICLLSEAQIAEGCRLAEEAGAAFVKTSTGFSKGGATEAAVRLMRQCVGDRLGVKAAGGIRTRAQALAMLEAGADRLGCSASLAILSEEEK